MHSNISYRCQGKADSTCINAIHLNVIGLFFHDPSHAQNIFALVILYHGFILGIEEACLHYQAGTAFGLGVLFIHLLGFVLGWNY